MKINKSFLEEERKFLKFKKLLQEEKNNDLRNYIRNLCRYRQVNFGYIEKNPKYEKNVVGIIEKRKTKEKISQRIELPEKFEKARDYLLGIQGNDKEAFERVIKELKKVRQK